MIKKLKNNVFEKLYDLGAFIVMSGPFILLFSIPATIFPITNTMKELCVLSVLYILLSIPLLVLYIGAKKREDANQMNRQRYNWSVFTFGFVIGMITRIVYYVLLK